MCIFSIFENLVGGNCEGQFLNSKSRKRIFLNHYSFIVCIDQNQNEKFKILSLKDLNQIEESKKDLIDNIYVVDYNNVFVTTFNDGTGILRPPVLKGEEGIFFNDISEMNKMIDSRIYPIKKSGNSFWEIERDNILKINSSILDYFSKLSKELDFNIELNFDSNYLSKLSDAITERLRKKKSNNLSNYIAIYIGELLRIKVGADWKLVPQKTFITYYIPQIVKNGKFASHWSVVMNDLEMCSYKRLDIEELIERINKFYPFHAEYIDAL